MARSCGLRIGPRRFELVVLDGGAKKHKITAWMAGELPAGGEETRAEAAAVLREALKAHDVPRENVGIAIDAGQAAFRLIKVPFTDRSKIEDVIKFEVESLLPQWNIDDVVVDFHVLETVGESSELLLTAVPKATLKSTLELCGKAGLEPLEAELESSAVFNAAMTAGLCQIDNAQVLVHVGENSTSVVVVDGGKVREMRAIHIGGLSHDPPAVAAEPAEGGAAAPAEALDGGLGGGEDAVLPDAAEIQHRADQALRRIRRELGRTVSAARTVHPIEAVYVCGLDLPGLVGSRILDAEVRILDAFEQDGGQPAEGFGQLVVAYGVAVRQLGGGVLRPSLRREELRYTGAFERLELPLAVVCLLLVTFLGVWLIFLTKERRLVEENLAYWRDSSTNYLVGNIKKGRAGYLQYPSDAVQKYIDNLPNETGRSQFEQMNYIQFLLRQEIGKMEKDLGQDTEIVQPQSAFQGAMLALGVLDGQIDNDNRVSLRRLQSTYNPGRQGKPDSVRVACDVTFLAEDSVTATQNYESFLRGLQAQPWCVEVERKASETIEGDKGIHVAGLGVVIDCSKAPAAKVTQ